MPDLNCEWGYMDLERRRECFSEQSGARTKFFQGEKKQMKGFQQRNRKSQEKNNGNRKKIQMENLGLGSVTGIFKLIHPTAAREEGSISELGDRTIKMT